MRIKGPSGEIDSTDKRKAYDFQTKYAWKAWVYIACETVYLTLLSGISISAVILMLVPISSGTENWYSIIVVQFFGAPTSTAFQYLVIAKFGLLGGCLFDIKWLVHTVATGLWHQDRVLWRFFTPLMSGVIAVFFGLIIQSGIISLFDAASFRNIQLAAGFGMLTGYFADSVIGVLSNLAGALFGTVQDRRRSEDGETKPPKP